MCKCWNCYLPLCEVPYHFSLAKGLHVVSFSASKTQYFHAWLHLYFETRFLFSKVLALAIMHLTNNNALDSINAHLKLYGRGDHLLELLVSITVKLTTLMFATVCSCCLLVILYHWKLTMLLIPCSLSEVS